MSFIYSTQLCPPQTRPFDTPKCDQPWHTKHKKSSLMSCHMPKRLAHINSDASKMARYGQKWNMKILKFLMIFSLLSVSLSLFFFYMHHFLSASLSLSLSLSLYHSDLSTRRLAFATQIIR